MSAESSHYRDAGVDIDLAQNLLRAAKGKIRAARRPEMLTDIGGFGGLFQLDLSRWRQPVLVCSIDGVGTKLMVAAMAGRHETVGYDIVHHCINDIAVQGAEPLYFVDYIGIGRLRSPLYEQMLGGIADACRQQHVALLGGETAEMPGMYADDYDLVGCITGVVDRPKIITGEAIAVGHTIIGLAANGLHTNGYSLARKVLFEQAGFTVDQVLPELGESVGDALLHPHVCYWPAVRELMSADVPVSGIAHITGGGLYDNISRILPADVDAVIDLPGWTRPPIFGLIQQQGDISAREMHRVFNMGIGLTVFLPGDVADGAIDLCRAAGFTAARVGTTVAGAGSVRIMGID